MDRMDDPELLSLHEWLADLFDSDMTVKGLRDTLEVRLRHTLSKGDPGVFEDVADVVHVFFSGDWGYCFPSTPAFDWTTTAFGSTRTLWFRLLKDRRARHARTTIIDDVRLYDIMCGDCFKPVREWLDGRVGSGARPDDVADELREQIEMVLNNDDTSVPFTVERIASNFFDSEAYFSFYPYVFGVPVARTEFGLLRNEWFHFKHSF